MNESQRAMVAGRLADMPAGRNWGNSKGANLPDKKTNKEAAELLNVSERSVKTANKIQTKGVEELNKAVEKGEVSVSAAADVAELEPEEQREVVAKRKVSGTFFVLPY